jgi:hypothetical protein
MLGEPSAQQYPLEDYSGKVTRVAQAIVIDDIKDRPFPSGIEPS